MNLSLCASGVKEILENNVECVLKRDTIMTSYAQINFDTILQMVTELVQICYSLCSFIYVLTKNKYYLILVIF